MKLLLYGANGYTGKLITQYASDYQLKPVLAGRREEPVARLAEAQGLEYQVFPLDDPDKLDQALHGMDCVLHAAGPFIHTARPMIEACIRNGVHYLDITGEIEVFEMANAYDQQARSAGVMLMPGTGFDVVPTDCMALYLKKKLPDATLLQLAFTSVGGGVSHGTAITMAGSLGEKGAVRQNGKIVKVPLGHKTMTVPFSDKSRFVMTIPWGDVATAYYSTGIPNIETYFGIHPSSYKLVSLQRYLGWLLRTSFVRSLLKRRIDKAPAGPSDEQRKNGKSLIWGRVRNESGEKAEARLSAPEGYTLTAKMSLIIAKKVLEGNAPIGFQTPAKAYGENLIMELDGVIRNEL